jgi:adenylate cyclase
VAPQLAEVVVAVGGEPLLQRQRREVTVVCCALQGFPALAATVPPEQAVAVLGDYHTVLGQQIVQWEGTLEQFAGARLRVVFNAPLACPDPAVRAVRMAVAMRDHLAPVRARWRTQPSAVDLSIGIAQGEATLGLVSCAGRVDYTTLGPVTALAERLCEASQPGQMLLSARVGAAVAGLVDLAPVPALSLPGCLKPGAILQVCGPPPAA